MRRHFRGPCSRRMVAPFAHDIGSLRHAHHVQNQRHPAITHNAGAGEGLDSLKLLAQRLDYDFFGIVDLVDDEPERAPIRLQDDDIDRSDASSFFCLLWVSDQVRASNIPEAGAALAAGKPARHARVRSSSAPARPPGAPVRQAYLRDGVAISAHVTITPE